MTVRLKKSVMRCHEKEHVWGKRNSVFFYILVSCCCYLLSWRLTQSISFSVCAFRQVSTMCSHYTRSVPRVCFCIRSECLESTVGEWWCSSVVASIFSKHQQDPSLELQHHTHLWEANFQWAHIISGVASSLVSLSWGWKRVCWAPLSLIFGLDWCCSPTQALSLHGQTWFALTGLVASDLQKQDICTK